MTDAPTADAAEPAVLIPPGLPLLDAATWLGHACWAELRLHAVITGWMAIEEDAAQSENLWIERADCADRAEAWFRRLPELREYPRHTFIEASSEGVARLFNGLTALVDPHGTDARAGALAAVLRGLRLGYRAQQELAVGPADAPTATALTAALRSTFGVGGSDPDPAWTAAVAEAGGLP